jgi:hypothetical protein
MQIRPETSTNRGLEPASAARSPAGLAELDASKDAAIAAPQVPHG